MAIDARLWRIFVGDIGFVEGDVELSLRIPRCGCISRLCSMDEGHPFCKFIISDVMPGDSRRGEDGGGDVGDGRDGGGEGNKG